MGNVARVFLRDVKRLLKTPAAWSVALFLIVLPSLYTWFNVAGFWNPYENTGRLEVCVVNEDAGATDEKLGKLDLGAQVVAQLEDNDQLGWKFTNRDEALDEVNSGRAYAAFIIPENFSKNVTTLLTGNFQRPTLEYYVNEKTGPVSPKITDTGANALDTTINEAFFSTVSSTVASAFGDRLTQSQAQIDAGKTSAAAKLEEAIATVRDAREAFTRLSENAEEARAKVQQAKGALAGAQGRIDELTSSMDDISKLVGHTNTNLVAFSGKANSALDTISADAAKTSAETTIALAKTAAALDAARQVVDVLPAVPGSDWEKLKSTLDSAAKTAENASGPVNDAVQTALKTADDYRADIATNTVPTISEALTGIATTSADLKVALANQKLLVDEAQDVLDQVDSTLALSTDALANTDHVLEGLEGNLGLVKADLAALGSSNALQQLVGKDGIDSDKLADFMMSPTQIATEELYPINAYGSAMAPLFMNLTLWIGVFMLMVIIRLEVDDEGFERLTITQRFFGRGALLSIMATLQACVCCTGCLLLGVQTVNAPLFYLTAVCASLAYLAVQYTLSATLQHVGKAFCIILVFVQIPGATGLYPIEMTPDFFQTVYPLFPFTYGINAIRETISGFYGYIWIQNVGVLLAFLVSFVAIGALLRPYLTNLNRLFARQIEESDIVNGESVQLPARRYRMSQVISAFADREEYRAALDARVMRFMGLYPRLKMGALVVGIGVLVVATAILGLAGVEKVVILTTWLIWFVLVMIYLIAVEYLQDYLSHLVSLETMSADEVRLAYAQREKYTRVQPLKARTSRGKNQTPAGKTVEDEGDQSPAGKTVSREENESESETADQTPAGKTVETFEENQTPAGKTVEESGEADE